MQLYLSDFSSFLGSVWFAIALAACVLIAAVWFGVVKLNRRKG